LAAAILKKVIHRTQLLAPAGAFWT
jgi:hypothetical protein